eukprot:Amastigsp_a515569_8.p2 type:complete len:120 gc:universal Amastigsp_a515569_8:443-84(-)
MTITLPNIVTTSACAFAYSASAQGMATPFKWANGHPCKVPLHSDQSTMSTGAGAPEPAAAAAGAAAAAAGRAAALPPLEEFSALIDIEAGAATVSASSSGTSDFTVGTIALEARGATRF